MMSGRAPTAAQPFTFDVGAIRLAGEYWGAGVGDRDPVVLLHGGGQTRHSWKRTAERIAAQGRPVAALDARGHGDSQWDPEQDYSLDAFAADVIAYLETLGRPAVLVGASLGGMTALMVVGQRPDLVKGLVLVDVVITVEPAGVNRIRDFMTAQPNGFASLEEVADAIAAYNPGRPRPTNLGGLTKNVRLGEDGRWRWHWDPAFMRNTDEPRRRVNAARLRDAAARVEVPTLIVRGMRSDVVSAAGVADTIESIPHAQIAVVPGAGHMVAGDDNDVFGTALGAFLVGLND
jgi:non-heme chloroperoxidase